jgi:hypothetical protein
MTPTSAVISAPVSVPATYPTTRKTAVSTAPATAASPPMAIALENRTRDSFSPSRKTIRWYATGPSSKMVARADSVMLAT